MRLSAHFNDVDAGPGSDCTRAGTVLILDDDARVGKSVARILLCGFDRVFTATTPSQAEALLGSNRVTHLVFDCDLGEGQPKGTDLVSRWRNEYPAIERAVIVTGSRLSEIDPPPEVDVVLSKPAARVELFAALAIDSPTQAS